MTNPPFPAPLAARDAARERVVRLLTDRYADDTLTVEEFEARLDRLHALHDPAALEAMARELERALERAPERTAPTLPAYPAPVAASYAASYAASTPASYPGPPTWSPNAPPGDGRIFAFMSNAKRRGAWAVPSRLRAVAMLGELVLDLREAVLPPACEIELFALLGNVRVILPPGADAYVELDAVVGSADDRTPCRLPGRPATGPRVRVTGTAILGEVKVLGG